MTRIFLIGYMGAGKTTLGKAFSRELGLTFIDLDWYIEERFHKTVQQLFSERGEQGFRELEQKMLHEVAEFEDVVISAGGFIILGCYSALISFSNSLTALMTVSKVGTSP